jgi:hypothetical protein
MTTTAIPLPAGAVSAGAWRRNRAEEFRPFRGTHRDVDARFGLRHVDIDGDQHSDGHAEYYMTIRWRHHDIPLDAEGIGPLTEALLAAREEIKALSDPVSTLCSPEH